MLKSIQPYVKRYARVIAKVVGIDVEVVDADMIRIAGTGIYEQGVGESIDQEGEVYRHVMKSRDPFIMENPREHGLCGSCQRKDQCRETMSVCTPIVDGADVVGVIGLVCFSDDERKTILQNRETYVDFLVQIAALIAHKLRDQRQVAEAQDFLDLMMQVMDVYNRGVVVFNAGGCISYINRLARLELGLEPDEEPGCIRVERTGDFFSDLEEFTVNVHGSRRSLVGRLEELPSANQNFASVLVFDSLPRMTQRMSQFSAGEHSGLNAILGKSRSLIRLKEQIRRVAASTSTVLITGESGTGKELVARAIHATSDRADKPFIAINCGALPDNLLESELFGYTKGAFTGANPKGKIGKFELADGGVIFLDEIGTLPLYLQVKLLRVLQERQFCRLGSNRLIHVDIRVIAATNDNLSDLIDQGHFREDLFYRLNVIPLETPPLRNRPEDMEVLGDYFLHKYCERFGKRPAPMDDAVLDAFKVYNWPGNVREFENAIEYMVNMMPDGGPLHPGLLPRKLLGSLGHGAPASAPVAANGEESLPLLPLKVLERRAIVAALQHFGSDTKGKKLAAESLQIGIATLYRKIKEYDIAGA
ncbi:sigma-54 interaction domain-containing protein [Salidesulfovibrio onnuriiensis]|uniref:sigma-54 interaction domain-containing protein n=1 Tax=Salidesulfovibrio onnuriiensis TaxID=2583823 RepID=UPI0011C9FD19|nr:sigma 54-interacting transcriptional regulator [Salidesulfovibrio onnuriiensis]